MSPWWITRAACKQHRGQQKTAESIQGHVLYNTPSVCLPQHQKRWLETHNIYSCFVCTGTCIDPIVSLPCLVSPYKRSKAAAGRQMITAIAVLTGGTLGGCKSLIKAIVNDAESTVEIKPLLFPLSIILKCPYVVWAGMMKMPCQTISYTSFSAGECAHSGQFCKSQSQVICQSFALLCSGGFL